MGKLFFPGFITDSSIKIRRGVVLGRNMSAREGEKKENFRLYLLDEHLAIMGLGVFFAW